MNEPPLIEVAPFVPVRDLFTYSVQPAEAAAIPQPGCRVLVPFGRRTVVGVVAGRVSKGGPRHEPARIRPVTEVLDAEPAIPPSLLEFVLWAARYYYAPPGEMIRAALPATLHGRERELLRLTAAGRAVLQAEAALLRRPDETATPQQLNVLRQLKERRGTDARRSPRTRAANGAALRETIERGWVERTRYRDQPIAPATDLLVELLDSDAIRVLRTRAPRQADLFQRLAAVGPKVTLRQVEGLPRDARTLVKKLERRGVLRTVMVERPRDPFAAEPLPADVDHRLTDEQHKVLERMVAALQRDRFEPFLLHGVTGSGKTEIYLRLIRHALDQGRTALVLVPEIALTPQLAARFRARFGDEIAVLHSGLRDTERYDQWRRIRSAEARIVVGARSAIFAPLEHIGVVVVDEEHDSSFKQADGIRYNARDLALVRAKSHRSVAVLGSATPSLESYWGVQQRRLELLELKHRATPQPLPTVEVIDLRLHRTPPEGLISAPLGQAIEATLAARQQVILFLNRRGYSGFMLCMGCGHVFRCKHCSVSLTYHQRCERLICHYCGFAVDRPSRCPACSGDRIDMVGFGTERVEVELRARYPNARVARLDRDTAAGRGMLPVLQRMQRREIDVLVGTQMVTKGHDFPNVTLVGVLCADLGLHFPDFRAGERTFQLLTQVAGRAGRGAETGRVLVQTYNPDHPAIVAAQRHDYAAFFAQEIASRRDVGYPPCRQLVALHVDGEDAAAVAAAARRLAARLRPVLDGDDPVLLGPAEAPIQRIKGRTRWLLLVKASSRGPLRRATDRLVRECQDLGGKLRTIVDVDPLQML